MGCWVVAVAVESVGHEDLGVGHEDWGVGHEDWVDWVDQVCLVLASY